jgi:HlyD family secretion protein
MTMATSRRRLLWLLLVPAVLAAGFFLLRGRGEAIQFTTGAVDRGDVVEVVGATGALEAVTTVQIGSQVSGTIQNLYADFNSTVKKGQVIVRLDPSIFDARLGQAKANLLAAKANVDRARSTVDDTKQKYDRAKELAATNLIAQTDLETAKANYDGAVAQIKAAEAAQSQAQANVDQAALDLSHTIIDTPIDGVVISRNVDVGQTVAASFQAPVLFVIANDLAQMRVNASVDEADVGRVREGQEVVFHVDAFPEREFKGTVEQVRLNPTTVSNVVSYNTIVAVDNRDLVLRPGMTATVSIVVRKAENALRLPASALRFRPDGYQRPAGRGGPGAAGAAGAAGAGGAPGGQGGMARSAAGRPQGGPAAGSPGGASGGGVPGAAMAAERGAGGGSGGPGGGRGRPTVVFVPDEKGQPKPVDVRTGVSDGQFVEVRQGLDEGAVVITGTEIPGARAAGGGTRPGASPSSNPFSPQRPQPRQR